MKKWFTLLLASTLMLTACGKSNEKASLEKSIDQLEKENKDLKKQKKDLENQKTNLKISKIIFKKISMNCRLKIRLVNHLKKIHLIQVKIKIQKILQRLIQNNQQIQQNLSNLIKDKRLTKRHKKVTLQVRITILKLLPIHKTQINKRLMQF